MDAWERLDYETLIKNEHKLYAEAHERAIRAEAHIARLKAELWEAYKRIDELGGIK